MLVKELIAKLNEHHPNRRVVVDTLEGFLDVYPYVVEGGTNSDGIVYEPVVVISMENDGILTPVEEDEDETPEGFRKYDISSEEFRSYTYSSVEGGKHFIIENPVTLYIKTDENGDSHRVVDVDGVTHCPVRGWIAISWYAPEQEVSF